MKHFKDLNACIAIVKAIQARDDIQPKQRNELAGVIKAIKALQRRKHVSKPEAYRAIREIVERLLNAFMR